VSQPFSETCGNDHRDDHWTCPACHTDLGDVGKGTHECHECKRLVRCSIEHFPSCRSRLVDRYDE